MSPEGVVVSQPGRSMLQALKEKSAARAADGAAATAWKILIVDDEPDIHAVTKLALTGFRFEDRPITFLNAYSSIEAFEILSKTRDIAVILLDVVMETESAGLDLVHRIRGELANHIVRIVLRTGQPGAAPESDVISRYDINDYKEKTELTSRKLYTLIYSCLRGYRDLKTIEANRRGLEKIIEASATIFRLQSLEQFTAGVLEQIDSLLNVDDGGIYARVEGIAAMRMEDRLEILAGSGRYEGQNGRLVSETLTPDAFRRITQCLDTGQAYVGDGEYIGPFKSDIGDDKVVYLNGFRPRNQLDRHLLEVFTRNVGISFENIHLAEAIEETQREMLYRLGGAVETRSKETANHVKRVSEMSYILAIKIGMSERDAGILKHASPMHDVGKIGIPDAVLNKPGKLDPQEWEIMKSHATMGYEILRDSGREIIDAGAVIALEHHERWDGKGYPFGKAGESISLIGRITAVADVFDALHSRRCYKEPWPLDRVLAYFNEQRGAHFDPTLVDLMLTNLDQMIQVCKDFADPIPT